MQIGAEQKVQRDAIIEGQPLLGEPPDLDQIGRPGLQPAGFGDRAVGARVFVAAPPVGMKELSTATPSC